MKILFHALLFCLLCIGAEAQEKVTFQLTSPDLSGDSAVYITGSLGQLGNWNPGKVKMEYLGNHTWRKQITVDAPLSLEYKYTRGSWALEGANAQGSPLANFEAKIAGDTIIKDRVSYWTKANQPKVVRGGITGTVRYHRAMKADGLDDRDVIVWLPPGYETNKTKRYAVVYMQDAQNIIDPATSTFGIDWRIDESADSLIRIKAIPPVIVVGINNTAARSDEYAPGEKGTAYMNFVINRVKPFIDATYRTKPARKHTLVGGSSSGGLISFMLLWEHPEVFSKAICMSPALKIEHLDYVSVVRATEKKRKNVFFYIDNGGIALESRLQPGIDEMVATLKAKGYKEGKDFVYVVEPSAPHSEGAWGRRFPRALGWCLGKK